MNHRLNKYGFCLASALIVVPSLVLAQTSFDLLPTSNLPDANFGSTLAPISIIIEPQGQVPVGFEAKANFLANTGVRLVALTLFPDEVARYRWYSKTGLGNELLAETSEPYLLTTSGSLGEFHLVVEGISDKNSLIARGETRQNYTKPQVLIYENNPLKGLSVKAIPKEYILIGEEVELKGELLFVEEGDNLKVDWWLNNNPVLSQDTTYTLRREEVNDGDRLRLEITDTKSLERFSYEVRIRI